MSSDDALAFCRRRLEQARDKAGDLEHAAGLLQDDNAEAEPLWADARGREVRQRDLEPHRVAADRQQSTLNSAIDAGRTLLVSLEEAARAERAVVAAVANARTSIQASATAIADARRDLDQARLAIQTAEGECAAAKRMLQGL